MSPSELLSVIADLELLCGFDDTRPEPVLDLAFNMSAGDGWLGVDEHG